MGLLAELHTIEKLPTLPEIFLEVLKLVSSDKANAQALASIIEQDPPLCARVLHVANSSYFSSAGKRMSSVSRAVARLGFNEVRNISAAVSIIKHFSNRHSVLDYKQFWRHSLTAAFIMRTICEKGPGTVDDAEKQQYFIAGLLHDIGIFVLDQFFPEKYAEVSQQGLKSEMSFLQAEKFVLDKDVHPTIGAALLEMWKLESPVIDAIRYHHSPLKCAGIHSRICAATACAEYALCNCSFGSFEGGFDKPEPEVWHAAGIASDNACSLIELAEAEVRASDMILMLGEGDKGLRMV